MGLRKCPGCKNTVSTESRWCPICGVDFRGRRIRRIVLILLVLAAGLWFFRGYIPWERLGHLR